MRSVSNNIQSLCIPSPSPQALVLSACPHVTYSAAQPPDSGGTGAFVTSLLKATCMANVMLCTSRQLALC